MSARIRISDEDVADLMTPADFVASCDEAFRLYGAGEMINPAREESLSQEDGVDVFHLALPGEWPGKYRGKKVIEERSDVETGRLGERSAVIELNDLVRAQHLVLDAEHITNMRTGAAGVLGAKYLCSQPIQKVAILGTGRIAKALALCAEVALSPQVISATSRKAKNREDFARDVGPHMSCVLDMVADLETCVSDANVVLAAVPTSKPLLHKHMIGKNAHISVLGGDSRTKQLAQALFLDRAVIPDHAEQVLNSGEFLAASEANRPIPWVKNVQGQIQNVGHLALGQLENLRDQGTIVYFSGMAVQDVHAASVAWERYQAHKM